LTTFHIQADNMFLSNNDHFCLAIMNNITFKIKFVFYEEYKYI